MFRSELLNFMSFSCFFNINCIKNVLKWLLTNQFGSNFIYCVLERKQIILCNFFIILGDFSMSYQSHPKLRVTLIGHLIVFSQKEVAFEKIKKIDKISTSQTTLTDRY